MSSVASCADRQDSSLYKKSLIYRRNNSGELDVFEAANYFSSVASNMTIHEHHQSVSSHKPSKELNLTTKSYKEHLNDQAGRPKGGRMSLDVVGRSSKMKVAELKSGHKVHDDIQVVKEKMIKNNKQKQPSSPGGRLASFLNSLFNHSASKKKKNLKQDDQIKPRMRRSSISHVDSRSLYLSESTASATGFRTPPPVYKTYFDVSKSLQDHKRVTTPSKSSVGLQDQRPNISNGSLSMSGLDNSYRDLANEVGEKDKVWGEGKIEFECKKVDSSVTKLEFHKVENNRVKHFEFKKHIKDEEEDGDDQSDTSSDLFELRNYDLSEFPSGLPVYETTNADQIKNSAKPDSKVIPRPETS